MPTITLAAGKKSGMADWDILPPCAGGRRCAAVGSISGRRQGSKRHDHGALLKQLKKLAEEAVKHCDLPGYRKRAVALLDEQMGAVPDSFLYRGRSYTARSFADSLRFKRRIMCS